MQIAQFETLVRRLELKAQGNHWAFRLKVSAYVALGYFLMIGILLGTLFVGAGLILARAIGYGIRTFAFGFHFASGLVRGLWLKFEPQDRITLESSDLAPLTQLAKGVCNELKAPKIHAIYLSIDCNASAFQRPILGPFGPFRNELTIGIPLLVTLTQEEVRAIFAHEIGHIHRGHSRFSFRIAQISSAWSEAVDEIADKRYRVGFLFSLFNWYSPWLSAAGHVLSRIAEKEANKAEAQVGGADVSAQVLVDLAIYAESADQILQQVVVESFSEDRIPSDLLLRYCRELAQPVPESVMIQRIERSLAVPYDPFGSHPPMSQCLRDLGMDPSLYNVRKRTILPGSERRSAGNELFGERFETLLERASRAWILENEPHWRKNRERYYQAQQEIDKLLETVRKVPPTDDERIALARRLLGFDRATEALNWIEPVKDRDGESRLIYGVILKELNEPTWTEWVEKAADDPEQCGAASRVLLHHYTAEGNRALVQRTAEKLEQLERADNVAAQQFLQLSAYWTYQPCTWSAEEREMLVALLQPIKSVQRAYLIGRTNGVPRYDNACLFVEYGGAFVDPKSVSSLIAKQPFPQRCAIFARKQAPPEVVGIPGSLVYERTK